MLIFGLTTGNKLGLGLIAAAFVAFALISSMVIPRRWPDFPGSRGLKVFVAATFVFFVAALAAVEIFAKEKKEARGPETTTSTQAPSGGTPPPAPAGNPAKGKAVLISAGCSACHRFVPAGAAGTVGPDLDTRPEVDAKKAGQPLAAFIRESIVKPNAYIAPGYPPNVMPSNFGQTLSKAQLDDLVAFLTQGKS